MLRESKPFHFVHLRKIWYSISGVFLVIAIASLLYQGLNLGIDFTGGSKMEIRTSEMATVEQVREVLEEFGLGGAIIQRSTDVVTRRGNEEDFLIRTVVLNEEENKSIMEAMEAKFGEVEVLMNDMVGPTIGRELLVSALLAFLVASLLMMGYIAWRFELKQGIATVISLLHDAIIVIGVFSVFQLEVDVRFVAAILIIIGYSINDRIVIFDRIRENLVYRQKGEDLSDVINNSLWQTMARSINT
ncbi:MAG: protein translocase subunit SecF, partial [Peptococcaceae bacterium]|nr:protein translocase subunit SecF [Peptococcaceae bacterium]